MISRLTGTLLALHEQCAEVRCAHCCYEVLVPACDTLRLGASIGQVVEFHTLEYLESQGQGAAYLPRLIGFASRQERAFFQLFTSVKGLGNKKALRALQLPFAAVAAAIAGKDVDLLMSLPEIGRRIAQTIVTELHEKVDRFVELKPTGEAPLAGQRLQMVNDAASVLATLGETRLHALRLAERAAQSDPSIDSIERLIAVALEMRESGP